jgi:hypothetical protein
LSVLGGGVGEKETSGESFWHEGLGVAPLSGSGIIVLFPRVFNSSGFGLSFLAESGIVISDWAGNVRS